MDDMKVLLRVIETLRPDLPNVVGAEKLMFDLLWLKISKILSPKSRAQVCAHRRRMECNLTANVRRIPA